MNIMKRIKNRWLKDRNEHYEKNKKSAYIYIFIVLTPKFTSAGLLNNKKIRIQLTTIRYKINLFDPNSPPSPCNTLPNVYPPSLIILNKLQNDI